MKKAALDNAEGFNAGVAADCSSLSAGAPFLVSNAKELAEQLMSLGYWKAQDRWVRKQMKDLSMRTAVCAITKPHAEKQVRLSGISV